MIKKISWSKETSELYFSIAIINIQDGKKEYGDFTKAYRRRYSITACIMSFLALEATINGLYYYIMFSKEKEKNLNIDLLSYNELKELKASWDKWTIREKFLNIPSKVSNFKYEEQGGLFKVFKEFIKFRNMLVHSYTIEEIDTIKMSVQGTNDVEMGQVINSKKNTIFRQFPLTKFSTNIDEITIEDAEKSLEVAWMMRKELYDNKLVREIFPLYKTENGNRLGIKEGNKIIDLFNRHFKDILNE